MEDSSKYGEENHSHEKDWKKNPITKINIGRQKILWKEMEKYLGLTFIHHLKYANMKLYPLLGHTTCHEQVATQQNADTTHYHLARGHTKQI